MIKKLLYIIPIFLLFISLPFTNEASADEEKPVAIFYSPHQDDELLTMGHAIKHYIHSGYEVHVVLLTDGSGSGSIHAVNRELQKKYIQPLTKKEFSATRNLEFIRSLDILGVERKNIHFSYLEDGRTTVSDIEQIVLQYVARYPDAKHLTLTYKDDHNDHKNAGQALKNLTNLGIIEKSKFYIQNVERNDFTGEYEPDVDKYMAILKEAAIPYTKWDPLYRMYSIGNISVKGHFDTFLYDPRSKFHFID